MNVIYSAGDEMGTQKHTTQKKVISISVGIHAISQLCAHLTSLALPALYALALFLAV